MSPMSNVIDDLAAKFLEARGESGESEQRVIDRLTKRLHISRNARREFEENLTFGQRLADRIAVFGGSWTFILIFLSLLLAWIVLNTIVLTRVARPFDAYPYIFLNLILSMLAALQAPVIMMSQNRHAAKDRVAAAHDYEVNLKSELEILGAAPQDRHAARTAMDGTARHAAATDPTADPRARGTRIVADPQ